MERARLTPVSRPHALELRNGYVTLVHHEQPVVESEGFAAGRGPGSCSKGQKAPGHAFGLKWLGKGFRVQEKAPGHAFGFKWLGCNDTSGLQMG